MLEKYANSNLNYCFPHILYNNLVFQFKNRPKNNEIPPSFPFDINHEKQAEKADVTSTVSEVQSFNINIILNTTALIENSLEALLVEPLNARISTSDGIISSSLKLLKEEVIKISSLEKYFQYFKKIYNKAVKDIISKDEMNFFEILFDIRNMIIHCSILTGKWQYDENHLYMYVNDSFYISLLEKIKKLFSLDNTYYCLPESLLYWNKLIDTIFLSVLTANEKMAEFAKSQYPEIIMPFAFYGKQDFQKIIENV